MYVLHPPMITTESKISNDKINSSSDQYFVYSDETTVFVTGATHFWSFLKKQRQAIIYRFEIKLSDSFDKSIDIKGNTTLLK